MNLKVNQILHHEKSLYQDVLVFESSDYGTVLVLDNVIQCTERDEFSYAPLLPVSPLNPRYRVLMEEQLSRNDHPPRHERPPQPREGPRHRRR